MRVSRFWSAAVTTAALLIFPLSAQAVMTTSQVTSPTGDPVYVFDDQTDGLQTPFAVSGTSNGAPGDLADVICTFNDGNSSTIVNDTVVGAGGAVAASGNASSLPQNTCRLRIVPNGGASNLWNRFSGPVVAVRQLNTLDKIVGGPNDGGLYDWRTFVAGLNGEQQINTLSSGGITRSAPYNPGIFDDASDAVDETLKLSKRFADEDGDHSNILVDGKNAYTPEDARALVGGAANFPGWEPMEFSFAMIDGVPAITESFPLVRCPNETFPADATCTDFVVTGVTLKRTYRMSEGGGASRMQDTFTSTDSAAHRVQLWYYVNHDEDYDTAWAIEGFDFARYAGPFTLSGVQLPAGPFTIFGRGQDEPTLSSDAATLGLTFGTPPLSLEWLTWDRFEAAYDLQVAAAKPAELSFSVASAYSNARVEAYAVRAKDTYAGPTVAFTAPAAGAVVAASPATITGTASDNVGVVSVTVNGVAATVTGGTWAASVALAAGVNALSVVAKDAAGNQASASSSVTFTAPVVIGGGPQKVFTGTAGNDTLTGNSADNVLDGLGGNDVLLCGAGGRDIANGGSGNDRIECVERYAIAKANRDVIDCGAGTRDIAIVDPFDTVKNCEKVTRVWNGGTKADKYRGTKADDRFNTLGGNDNVTCGGGVDSAKLGAGNDTINCYDIGTAAVKKKSRDVVDCGAGTKDVAIVDKFDVVKNCEKVIRKA